MSKHKNSKHISTKKLAYIGLDLAYKTDDLNIYNLEASKIGRVSILQLRLLKSYTFNKSTNNLIMNI